MRKHVAAVLAIIAGFGLTGCESDFDKCVVAEQAKLVAQRESTLASIPVLRNAAILTANRERLREYKLMSELSYRAALESLRANQPCDEGDKQCDSALEDAAHQAAYNDTLEAGFRDLATAWDEFMSASNDLVNSPEGKIVRDKSDAFERGYQFDPNDPQAVADKDVAWTYEQKRLWEEQLLPDIDVSTAAREICKSRGFHE